MGAALDPLQSNEHGSIDALERRVEHLRRLAEQSPSDAHQSDAALTFPQMQETPAASGAAPRAFMPPQATMDGMQYLPQSALTEVRDGSGAVENRMGFSTLLGAAVGASNQRLEDTVMRLNDLDHELGMNASQPAPAVARAAVQQYAAFCEVFCPVLGGSDAARQFLNYIDGDTASDTLVQEDVDVLLLNLAIATGIFMLKGYRYREAMAATLAKQAQSKLLQTLSCLNSPKGIRCILALAVFSDYSSLGGSTWALVGLAISRCFSLGLHTDEDSVDEVSQTRGQLGIGVFRSTYILDSYAQSCHQRLAQRSRTDYSKVHGHRTRSAILRTGS